MKATRFLGAMLMALTTLILAACGGGGDGSEVSSGTPSPMPVTKPYPTPNTPIVTLRQSSELVSAAVGETVRVANVTVECAQTGTLCTNPGILESLKLASNIPLESFVVTYLGNTVAGATVLTGTTYKFTPTSAMNLTAPGSLEVSAKIASGATPGASSAVAFTAQGGGNTIATVVTNPSTLSVKSSVTLGNATSYAFTRAAYGDLASFDLVCPVGTGGCVITSMTQVLSATTVSIPKGAEVHTFVGTIWWYQLPTTKLLATMGDNETFSLVSPLKIAEGTTKVTLRGNITAGNITVVKLEMATANGKLLTVVPPAMPAGCQTVLAGLLSCKG